LTARHEDSTAYNTGRLTGSGSLNADLPMTVAFAFRDFMENDTGLEYIGERNQQMGDGGAIAHSRMQTAMFCDGCKLAVSDRNMRQLMSCEDSRSAGRCRGLCV
jgi:hypothetical protein